MRCGLLIIVAITPLLSACNPFSSKLVQACESAIQDRLVAPSTYSFIEVREYSYPVTTEEYKSFQIRVGLPNEAADSDIAYAKQYGRVPTVFVADTKYDAKNSFGVPLRNTVSCAYLSTSGNVDMAARYNIFVDDPGINELVLRKITERFR